jgi:hypothetical protein
METDPIMIINITEPITRITYGYGDYTIDVTDIILKIINDDLELDITNELFKCDPATPRRKILTVEFSHSSIMVDENTRVKFNPMIPITYNSMNKIYVYFHICLINNWVEVVTDMYNLIMQSGLLDVIDELCLSVLGTDLKMLRYVLNHPKIRIIYISFDTTLFERPTLYKIRDRCQDETCKILYIHSKGVSRNFNTAIKAWVVYLCYFNIERYQECLERLNDYDICGTEWLGNHFRGNFWWGNSNYLRTLPSYIPPEYVAPESWIAAGPNKIVFNFYNSLRYPYVEIIDEKIYRCIK